MKRYYTTTDTQGNVVVLTYTEMMNWTGGCSHFIKWNSIDEARTLTEKGT